MDNHFHLLVRVPHRPEGFDVPLEVVVARLERALGEESAKLLHRHLEFWRTTKNEVAIETWRQQQVTRMFYLSEFMKAVQLRFCLLRRLCENGFAGFQLLSRRAVPML